MCGGIDWEMYGEIVKWCGVWSLRTYSKSIHLYIYTLYMYTCMMHVCGVGMYDVIYLPGLYVHIYMMCTCMSYIYDNVEWEYNII
jgi:hypothetical protein